MLIPKLILSIHKRLNIIRILRIRELVNNYCFSSIIKISINLCTKCYKTLNNKQNNILPQNLFTAPPHNLHLSPIVERFTIFADMVYGRLSLQYTLTTSSHDSLKSTEGNEEIED